VNYVNAYYANKYMGGNPPNLKTVADLQAYLASTDPMHNRYLEWFPSLYSNSANYDVSQIHYYAPSNLLASVFQFARLHLQASGTVRPIEVWELGYGWIDRTTYDPTAHAQETVRLLSTAAGEGASRVVYWKLMDEVNKKGGTVPSRDVGLIQNNALSPAAVAFQLTVKMLAGSTTAQSLDFGNSAVVAYRFARGGVDTYVIWTTGNSATVPVPSSTGSVSITDISGKTTVGNAQSVSVGVSPVFVRPN
jgi:hypothetical protein